MSKQQRTSNNPYLEMARKDARHYRRQHHLPPLLPLWPGQLHDDSPAGTRNIIDQLETALLSERRRGRCNHWCYDLNRHLALVSALQGERAHLASLTRQAKKQEK